MTARLFTQAELDTMCRPPKEQMMAALEAGDRQAAKNKYAELEAAFLAFHDIYYHWVATIQEFLYERYGHDGLAKAAPLGAVLIEALKLGLSVGEVLNCSQSATERMAALIDAGDVEGAKRLYAYMEKGFRDLHDLYREWTSMLLSHVYRTYGIGALEDCLRFSSERRWMPWMMEDITRDAKDRLQSWVSLLLGNFATIRVEEDDEKFTIFQNPCGSCGRQILDGCYKPPLSLAAVTERHPITFNRGNVTVYQAHLAVMHTIMPIERIGAPWPAIVCPGGADGGPCQIFLYKNPRAAAPEHYAMVGMQRPS
ncbi:MAG: hypothetical protein AB1671_03790 [Thermodesulfobacteriota bacterium]|jgi:hypothetical protein